jgi:hypothetical protein
VPGPLPKSFNIQTHGGTLLLFASGSGKTTNSDQLIGMNIKVDNVLRGHARCHGHDNNSHYSFVANALVVSGLTAGNHTIQLVEFGSTQTNAQDRYSVTALELPF